MNRRSFLAALAAPLVLDPERLLWRPGAKLISIPATRLARWTVAVEVGDVITIAGLPGRYIVTDGPAFEPATVSLTLHREAFAFAWPRLPS